MPISQSTSIPATGNSSGFQWNGTPYQFIALPFGLSTAPRVFSKVMKEAVSQLWKERIRLIYIAPYLRRVETISLLAGPDGSISSEQSGIHSKREEMCLPTTDVHRVPRLHSEFPGNDSVPPSIKGFSHSERSQFPNEGEKSVCQETSNIPAPLHYVYRAL